MKLDNDRGQTSMDSCIARIIQSSVFMLITYTNDNFLRKKKIFRRNMSIIQPTHSVEFPLQCMNFSKSKMKPDRKSPLTNASSVLLFPHQQFVCIQERYFSFL